MSYRVLVDEDVHRATAAVLRDRGHDAVSVAETLGKGTTDEHVHEYAVDGAYLVLTHDSDFLDPDRLDDAGVLYVPDAEVGPGTVADRVDRLAEHVPSQDDLPDRIFLTGTRL